LYYVSFHCIVLQITGEEYCLPKRFKGSSVYFVLIDDKMTGAVKFTWVLGAGIVFSVPRHWLATLHFTCSYDWCWNFYDL